MSRTWIRARRRRGVDWAPLLDLTLNLLSAFLFVLITLSFANSRPGIQLNSSGPSNTQESFVLIRVLSSDLLEIKGQRKTLSEWQKQGWDSSIHQVQIQAAPELSYTQLWKILNWLQQQKVQFFELQP